MRRPLKFHCQAEITQKNPEVWVDHYILRLDVAMDNVSHVAGLDSCEQLAKDKMTLVFGKMSRSSRHHKFVKISTWDVGRHHYDFILSHDCFG